MFLIFSVKKAPTPSATFGKKGGVFGSMTVEELKSKGFVRESVQKVCKCMYMYSKMNTLLGIITL
jgi:hypothetical protein